MIDVFLLILFFIYGTASKHAQREYIIAIFQPDKLFILDTDASNESVGAVLSQEIDGNEHVIA